MDVICVPHAKKASSSSSENKQSAGGSGNYEVLNVRNTQIHTEIL